MTEWEKAINVEPYDTDLKLVYADWLEEQGRETEAAAWRWVTKHKRFPADMRRYFEWATKHPKSYDPGLENDTDYFAWIASSKGNDFGWLAYVKSSNQLKHARIPLPLLRSMVPEDEFRNGRKGIGFPTYYQAFANLVNVVIANEWLVDHK